MALKGISDVAVFELDPALAIDPTGAFRAEHLPGAVNALPRLPGEMAHDDLRDFPSGDPAPREDFVPHEIDAVADLDPPRHVLPKCPAAAVDVVQMRPENPPGEGVQAS